MIMVPFYDTISTLLNAMDTLKVGTVYIYHDDPKKEYQVLVHKVTTVCTTHSKKLAEWIAEQVRNGIPTSVLRDR